MASSCLCPLQHSHRGLESESRPALYVYVHTVEKEAKLEKQAEKRVEEAAELAAADGIIAESEAIQSAMKTSGKNARVGALIVKASSVSIMTPLLTETTTASVQAC
jgi:hypothetical protein